MTIQGGEAYALVVSFGRGEVSSFSSPSPLQQGLYDWSIQPHLSTGRKVGWHVRDEAYRPQCTEKVEHRPQMFWRRRPIRALDAPQRSWLQILGIWRRTSARSVLLMAGACQSSREFDSMPPWRRGRRQAVARPEDGFISTAGIPVGIPADPNLEEVSRARVSADR